MAGRQEIPPREMLAEIQIIPGSLPTESSCWLPTNHNWKKRETSELTGAHMENVKETSGVSNSQCKGGGQILQTAEEKEGR